MQTVRKQTLADRLEIACFAAEEAGKVILSYYGHEKTIDTKSSTVDLVTNVDQEADELIRRILSERCPEDTLITEESFEEADTVDLASAWVVDPLDGTTNYAHGYPHFAVSIAYVEEGVPLVGVIFDPYKNELFSAIRGGEVMLNNKPIKVSENEALSGSLLATGFPYTRQSGNRKENNLYYLEKFLRRCHAIRRAGAAALDMVYVACGRLDGFWELHLSPWDIAAGVVILEQAGGEVTGFDGEPLDISQRRIDIVGSNGRIHREMIAQTTHSQD